jgi:hypothetical protein
MPNIIGLFDSRREAESAIHQLVNSGINRDYISIVSRNDNQDTRETDNDTSGAAKGAGIGAVLGGVGGLLAALAGLAILGIGPIVEEVVVGKTSQDRTETVRDKVRRTDVEVERSGGEEAGHERHR